MASTEQKLTPVDPVWDRLVREAGDTVAAEPLLGGLVHSSILHHRSFEAALAYRVSVKLASPEKSLARIEL